MVAKIVDAERLVVLALPVTARLLSVVWPDAERLVDDALPRDDEAEVRLVVDALERLARPVRLRLPIDAPVALKLVVDALVKYAVPVAEKLVVDARTKYAFVA